jgi:hypothetical protein
MPLASLEDVQIELVIDALEWSDDAEPRAFRIGGRRVGVAEVLDRWLGAEHRYFKLRGDDGAVYIVRHDQVGGEWELAVYDRSV